MDVSRRYIISVLLLCSVVVACEASFGSEKNTPATHRERLFRLSGFIMHDVAAKGLSSEPAAITLQLEKTKQGEFFRHSIIQSLIAKNISVYERQTSADTTLELSVRESSVVYGEVFSESLFGSRKVERKINLKFDVSLSSVTQGNIFWSQTVSHSLVDTVFFSDVAKLHDSAIPLSTYSQPELSFLESIIEPAIVTVAAGVAIYLFFTIRS